MDYKKTETTDITVPNNYQFTGGQGQNHKTLRKNVIGKKPKVSRQWNSF